MTRAVIALVAALALSSCSAVFDMTMDASNMLKCDGMELYHAGFAEIEEPDDIARWIYANIKYEWDYVDHWQTPKETMDSRTGDCEDMAILYINILYVRFGVKADMALVNDDGRQIVDGGWYNHAVVALPDGRLISAQGGRLCDESMCFLYTFKDLFDN